ncbi:MAG: serine kinase [Pseudomonadota bacterium]
MPGGGAAHLHASTVVLAERALIIAGPSGAGKSSLALEMMALGAGLIADDVTELFEDGGALWARAPATLPAAIEARGLGLLRATLAPPAPVAALIDLSRCTAERMPQVVEISLLGHAKPLLQKPESGPVSASLVQYLKHVTLRDPDV